MNLVKKIIELASDDVLKSKLEISIAGLAVKNSADLIASEILSLVNKSNADRK